MTTCQCKHGCEDEADGGRISCDLCSMEAWYGNDAHGPQVEGETQ